MATASLVLELCKRKLLRKRRCYASSRVPVELVEAIAESAREDILADWNDNLNFGTFEPGSIKLYIGDQEVQADLHSVSYESTP